MSSQIFRGFLLLGFLCLWVIPTEQALTLTITQAPNPAVVDGKLTLTVTGVDASNIKVVSWYLANKVDQSKLIAGKVITTPPTDLTKTTDVGTTTMPANNILEIASAKKYTENFYTVQIITDKEVGTATITLFSSSNLCTMSSSVLLLAAVLFSSLRLL